MNGLNKANTNPFPPVSQAMTDPNGLLASGGELSIEMLLHAYANGIFPWYNDDQPLLWWSPDPRAVINPQDIYISRSVQRTMRRKNYRLTLDTAFSQVINFCADVQRDSEGSWIHQEMRSAYIDLHKLHIAHSVEVWNEDQLIGGMYGIQIGSVFSGESMFHLESDASKIAMIYLCSLADKLNITLLDCQIANDHLMSMGAVDLSRDNFVSNLPTYEQLSDVYNQKPWSTEYFSNSADLARKGL